MLNSRLIEDEEPETGNKNNLHTNTKGNCFHNSPQEEGQPTEKKSTHNDAQSACRLPFPSHCRYGRRFNLYTGTGFGYLTYLQMLLQEKSRNFRPFDVVVQVFIVALSWFVDEGWNWVGCVDMMLDVAWTHLDMDEWLHMMGKDERIKKCEHLLA